MKTVRIGAGLGFYGDSWRPVAASIERGGVRYIGSDHLAELTLAILQKDRMKDPAAGYTRDLVPMLASLWPLAQKHGVRFVLNAGGLNPEGARDALAAEFARRGWKARIATVTGDSVMERIDALRAAGEPLAHMDTGAPIDGVREKLLFASAYLGAKPLVEALATGADIVLSGRVADAALFLAPLIHEFGWSLGGNDSDYSRLAQGLTVGHLLECSGQGSGGNFNSYLANGWESVPDLAHIGYPIAEVREDGTAVITKAPGTGGRVDFDTVRQQLLYEVHNPHAYFSPDVVLDMGTLSLKDLGGDRVEVSGATGRPRPSMLKIVAGYQDGWAGTAQIGYSWPGAMKKARASAAIIEAQLRESGLRYDEIHTEFLGYNSLLGPLADDARLDEINEVYLRMVVRSQDRRLAEAFPRQFPWLALSGPPTASGFSGIEPARQLLGLWPTLVRRELVEPQVKISVTETLA
ncbi:MAG: DUF1446 domain-containing protein [Rhodocyclaceae bacterium]|jgi:hypothetical protein|nr:DUF1446 domain-containing protein [Rhodocyclaceae bacterium]